MWHRLPVWLRAIVLGLVVSGIPAFTWAALASVNLRLTPKVPWSAPLMAAALWSYWRYLQSGGFRREHFRAKALSPDTWRLALLACGSAVAGVWAAFASLRGVLHITPQLGDVAKFPLITVAAAIVMGSIVAGVAEEAGFRGFMQLPLERAYGPTAAIATTSVIFTLIHLSHGARVLPFLPFYVVVAAAYGLVTYLTGSIVPSLTLHTAGDTLMFTLQYLAVRFGAAAAGSGRIEIVPALIAIAFAFVSVFAFRVLARKERGIALESMHAV